MKKIEPLFIPKSGHTGIVERFCCVFEREGVSYGVYLGDDEIDG